MYFAYDGQELHAHPDVILLLVHLVSPSQEPSQGTISTWPRDLVLVWTNPSWTSLFWTKCTWNGSLMEFWIISCWVLLLYWWSLYRMIFWPHSNPVQDGLGMRPSKLARAGTVYCKTDVTIIFVTFSCDMSVYLWCAVYVNTRFPWCYAIFT